MSDSDTMTKGVGRGDMFDRITKFIRDVGFPMAVAIAMFAYFWVVGRATNEYMARGTAIMERAVGVIEKLEKKIGP